MLDNKDDSTSMLKCPMCRKFVKATTCGLNNCVWRMTGIKAGSDVTISTKYTTVGDHYYTFKEAPSVKWTRLLIQVRDTPAESCRSENVSPIEVPDRLYSPDPTWLECAICNTKNPTFKREALGCNHAYHTSCLLKWSKCGETQCPICRFKIQEK
eukprot:10987-Heterococcus_DN1.PRE.3